jgi:signal transduction histidine kinase
MRMPYEQVPDTREPQRAAVDAGQQLLTLRSITAALAQARTEEDVAHLATHFCRPLGAVCSFIVSASDETASAAGGESAVQGEPRFCRDESLSQWLAAHRDLVERCPPLASQSTTLAVLPLQAGRSRDTLLIAFQRSREFRSEERILLECIAQQVAFRLEHIESLDDAERERRLRKELIEALSHELRNPLASIAAINEALKVRPEPDDGDRWQRAMDRQIAHMSDLLNRMLEVSPLEPAHHAHRAGLDVCAVLRDALEDKRIEIENRGLAVRADLGEERGGHWIMGDRVRLTQAFHCLLAHAIESTDSPGEIAVACRPDTSGGAVITFRDTGSGISPAALANVFEPVLRSPSRAFGSGFGSDSELSLVKSIVDTHGGSIWADSRGPGTGTTFTLVLPPPRVGVN